MKNLSKVLAVVLAFAMALSMVSFAAYTDVAEDANYSEAVAVLSDLSILTGYEDGSFKPEATITRAEFATVVIRMLGLADSASGGAEIFTDVAADHWANGYIALAAQQGIVNGYGDGRFGPEDPVKYQEAIKMVVAALGYTPMADANGGYPGGYKVVASQKGILAGVTGAKDNEAASRAIVAQLAYNSLAVPLMEQTGFGTQTNFQTVSSLLLNKLGITKFEGTVEGTFASGGVSKAGKVQIKANRQYVGVAGKALAEKVQLTTTTTVGGTTTVTPGVVMTVLATEAAEEASKDLLDTASIIYVKDVDSDDATIVSILKDGNRNATAEFMVEDLKVPDGQVNASNLDGTLAVSGEDTTLEVYTDKDAGEYEEYDVAITKLYINGQQKQITAGNATITAGNIPTLVNTYLNSGAGVDVKLLSNGTNEDIYNVAYLTVWADYVVKNVSARNYTVYTNAGSLKLDETSKTQNFTIYKDGEVVEFADIKENDVLSVAGYVNAGVLEYGEIYITSEQVEGAVTGKSTSENEIKVAGESYKTTASVKSSVSLGDTAVFYVNARGVLVGLDKTATGANLKYGFAAYIYEDANFGDSQIRMLSADGVWATYDVADKFTSFDATATLNDGLEQTAAPASVKDVKKFDLKAAAFNWTGVAGISGTVFPSSTLLAVNKVVAYDLDADGKVKEIYFATSNMPNSPFDATGVQVSADTTAANKLEYKEATGRIGNNEVDENTVIFNLNGVTLGQTTKADEKDITVVALSSLVDRDKHTFLNGYNLDDDTNLVGVLVGTGVAGGINWINNFFVVTDTYETSNEAGDEGIMVSGIQAGEAVSIFLNGEDLVSGDIQKAALGTGATDLKAASHTTKAATDIAKGDVLLYTLNAKGEAGKVMILVEASDVATGSGSAYKYLTGISTDTAAKVGKVNISGTDYEFVFGYAKEFKDAKLTIAAIEGGNTMNQLRFSVDTIGAIYDAWTANGKVYDGIYGDIVADVDFTESVPGGLTDNGINDGDMVFARVSAGVIVEDFVVFANKR